MEANELRIGNWIELKNSGLIQIDVDNIVGVVNNPAIFQPISLTPEILEKCGFIRRGNEDLIFKHENEHFYIGINSHPDDYVLQTINQDPVAVIKGIHFNTFNNVGKPFKYLHQLQNLYFALTGTELEIKNLVEA